MEGRTTKPAPGALRRVGQGGQALIEFALVVLMFLMLMFGIVDLSRAVYSQIVVAHLAREGANLASRGTPLTDAVNAVISSSTPLDFSPGGQGFVVVSRLISLGGNVVVEDQKAGGGGSHTSKVGSKGNNASNVPAGLPAEDDSLCVAEVFYNFKPITPLGSLLKIALPSTLYDAAYF
jgi:hypothetical protein